MRRLKEEASEEKEVKEEKPVEAEVPAKAEKAVAKADAKKGAAKTGTYSQPLKAIPDEQVVMYGENVQAFSSAKELLKEMDLAGLEDDEDEYDDTMPSGKIGGGKLGTGKELTEPKIVAIATKKGEQTVTKAFTNSALMARFSDQMLAKGFAITVKLKDPDWEY